MRQRRAADPPPQHGRDHHPAVDDRRGSAARRDQREPLIGKHLIQSVAAPAHRGGLIEDRHAHSSPSSLASASARVPLYAPVDRYFQPPSATSRAMSARSPAAWALAASARPACSTQPAEIPPKRPSARTSCLVRRSASAADTENLEVRTESSYSSGTNPSSMFRRPYTSSPYRGSAATICTPGTCSRR